MFEDTTRFVARPCLPDHMSLDGFCAVFARRNALGKRLDSPVVFGALFEALIFGHARFVQRSLLEVGLGNQPRAGVAAATCVV